MRTRHLYCCHSTISSILATASSFTFAINQPFTMLLLTASNIVPAANHPYHHNDHHQFTTQSLPPLLSWAPPTKSWSLAYFIYDCNGRILNVLDCYDSLGVFRHVRIAIENVFMNSLLQWSSRLVFWMFLVSILHSCVHGCVLFLPFLMSGSCMHSVCMVAPF